MAESDTEIFKNTIKSYKNAVLKNEKIRGRTTETLPDHRHFQTYDTGNKLKTIHKKREGKGLWD